MIQNNVLSLSRWLNKIFWVLGSYIFTSGLLFIYIALTSFCSRGRGASGIVTLTASTSIGLRTLTNIIIKSDFKWILVVITIPSVISMILYQARK